MREVDEALELMKKEYKSRMDACEEKRQRFEHKQLKMREQVAKFEKFIQENDLKRNRAELKAKQERKQFEQKCAELNSLADKVVELENDQKTLQEQLVVNSCYKIYLERVIEADDQGYEEVNDLLNRYTTLKTANRDLMQHALTQENNVDEMRTKLNTLKMETQNHLLVCNSQFQQYQKELEATRAYSKNEEEEKNMEEDKKKSLVRETSQVITSIRNIFGRCVASMRINPLTHQPKDISLFDSLDANLDVILDRMTDLMSILSEHSSGAESGALSVAGDDFLTGDLNQPSGVTSGRSVSGKSLGTNSSKQLPAGSLADTQIASVPPSPIPSSRQTSGGAAHTAGRSKQGRPSSEPAGPSGAHRK